MSSSLCTAFYLPILLAATNVQTLLATAVSQSNLQPMSNQIDAASIAQHLKSHNPHLADYPIGSQYGITGVYRPRPEPQPSISIGQEESYASNYKPDILEREVEEKRAFKFGKRESEATDKRNKMAFKFGKKSETSEADEKRAFKFGKKSNLQPVDYDSEVKRGGFKFGKRFSVQDLDNYDDLNEKRAFKFGKRFADNDIPKRTMFKFGKRPHSGRDLNEEAILGDALTRGWEDVKEDASNGHLHLYESARPINSYQPQFISPELDGLKEEDKRAFKFGKKSVDAPDWSELMMEDKRAFKFGKKSLSDWKEQVKQQKERYLQRSRQNEEGMDRRMLFKLGKRSDQYDPASDEEMMKRQFKFGK